MDCGDISFECHLAVFGQITKAFCRAGFRAFTKTHVALSRHAVVIVLADQNFFASRNELAALVTNFVL